MKDIPGFEGLYSISEVGKVWSKPRKAISKKRSSQKVKGRFLSHNIHYKSGYYSVQLCKEGVNVRKNVHRLVALTYIPNPEKLPVVNHKNGVKSDNRVENLEWCTHSQNSKHAFSMGLLKTPGTKYDVKIKVEMLDTK